MVVSPPVSVDAFARVVAVSFLYPAITKVKLTPELWVIDNELEVSPELAELSP